MSSSGSGGRSEVNYQVVKSEGTKRVSEGGCMLGWADPLLDSCVSTAVSREVGGMLETQCVVNGDGLTVASTCLIKTGLGRKKEENKRRSYKSLLNGNFDQSAGSNVEGPRCPYKRGKWRKRRKWRHAINTVCLLAHQPFSPPSLVTLKPNERPLS
jgi:hypothetical protein